MRENFEHATVIILATRFRIIVQCDRVIVMNHGKVVEFDTPLGLLNDPKSKFSLMLAQTGDIDPVKLRQLAQSRADSKLKGAGGFFYPESMSTSISVANRGLGRRESSLSSVGSSSSGSTPASLHGIFENK